jgi:hypothetical protein
MRSGAVRAGQGATSGRYAPPLARAPGARGLSWRLGETWIPRRDVDPAACLAAAARQLKWFARSRSYGTRVPHAAHIRGAEYSTAAFARRAAVGLQMA